MMCDVSNSYLEQNLGDVQAFFVVEEWRCQCKRNHFLTHEVKVALEPLDDTINRFLEEWLQAQEVFVES